MLPQKIVGHNQTSGAGLKSRQNCERIILSDLNQHMKTKFLINFFFYLENIYLIEQVNRSSFADLMKIPIKLRSPSCHY